MMTTAQVEKQRDGREGRRESMGEVDSVYSDNPSPPGRRGVVKKRRWIKT
jgi:hypothetical protein